MGNVLTLGTFDVLHVGHIRLFQRAERYGELTVGVNSDRFVESFKGHAPLYDEDERQDQVALLGYPTRLNDGPGRELIYAVQPSVLVVGSDWLGRDYLAQIDMTEAHFDILDLTLVYVPRTVGITTSDIVDRVLSRDG